MNPLRWKREHQVALGVGAGAGFLIGLIVGRGVDRGMELPFFDWLFGVTQAQGGFYSWISFVGLWWGLAGLIIGGAIVYIYRLMQT